MSSNYSVDWRNVMRNQNDDQGTYVQGFFVPKPRTFKPYLSQGTRLVITKILFGGFKSFGPNQSINPVGKGFNAIVGSRQSGKSNALDAILFILGYPPLDIGKSTYSIHRSLQYQNIENCTVTVGFGEILDYPQTSDVIPGSEFEITRTVDENNTFVYQLNGRIVGYERILELVRSYEIDIDLHRFTILQGKVNDLSGMKAKADNPNEVELLEYLDIFFDTVRYKKTLLEIVTKLEILTSMRTQKNGSLQMFQKNIQEYEEKITSVITFMTLENKAVCYENFIIQKHIYNTGERQRAFLEEKDSITETRNKLNEKLNSIINKRARKEKSLKIKIEKIEKLQNKHRKLIQALDDAKGKIVEYNAAIIDIQGRYKKLRIELRIEHSRHSDFEETIETQENVVRICIDKLNQFFRKKEQLENEKIAILQNLYVETAELRNEKAQVYAKLLHMQKIVMKTRRPYESAESKLQLALSHEEERRGRDYSVQLEESYQRINNEIRKKSEEMILIKQKISSLEKPLQVTKSKLNYLNTEIFKSDGTIKYKVNKLNELSVRMQKALGMIKVLEALIKEQNKGNCSGIFGRLGDLGKIDAKYNVAISAVCKTLNCVVVDTVATAHWCIEFLRVNKIGKASFIVLESHENFRKLANSTIETPENVPRLYDLIHIFDAKLKTAFYFALKDTLVANDLHQATRIARGPQPYKVVTLKGEIIDSSGALVPVVKTQSQGRMGPLSACIKHKEIKKLEFEVKQEKERRNILLQNRIEAEFQLNGLESELNEERANLDRCGIELQHLKTNRPLPSEKSANRKYVAETTKSVQKRIQKLQISANIKRERYERAARSAQALQSNLNQITRTVKRKIEETTVTVNKRLSITENLIDKCETDLAMSRMSVYASKRKEFLSSEQIRHLENNIAIVENQMRQINAEKERNAALIRNLTYKAQQVVQDLTHTKQQFEELRNETTYLANEEHKLILQKTEIENALIMVDNKLQECPILVYQWHMKLSQLKVYDILQDPVKLRTYSLNDLNSLDIQAVEQELLAMRNNLNLMNPDFNIVQEHQHIMATYRQKCQELDNITLTANNLIELHHQVCRQRNVEFMESLRIINTKAREIYQMFTGQGDLHIDTNSVFSPFWEGIHFMVKTPDQLWHQASDLTGRERTFASLSLLFALHFYKPMPFYLMDEIDDSFDLEDLTVLGYFFKEMGKRTQLLVVSDKMKLHRLSDQLIGIFKVFGCSYGLSLQNHQIKTEKIDYEDQEPQPGPSNAN